MTDRRAALVDRFRTVARQRIAAVRDGIRSDDRPEPDTWAEWLGGLHTTKGEARMLGMPQLAEVVHALEDQLQRQLEPWAPIPRHGIARALDVAVQLLEPGIEADEIAGLRSAALVALRNVEDATPQAPAAPTPVEPRRAPAIKSAFVQANVAQLDSVCDGLEELRASIAKLVARRDASREDIEDLLGHVEQLSTTASELRLGPLEPLLSSLARHAQDLAAQQGKRLSVSVDAAGTSLERTIIDTLAESLLHLARNAVDHGVRPDHAGRLTLSASARSSSVTVVVEDDGPGIDPARIRDAAVMRGLLDRQAAAAMSDEEALDLVFRPHFSTRLEADEVAGRGLGLDVVRRVVESIGGRVAIEQAQGGGTRFVLDVPMRLTREATLVVELGAMLVGLPSRHVAQVVDATTGVQTVAGGRAIRVDGDLVPLRDLGAAMGLEAVPEPPIALVIELGDRRWALAIPKLVGELEVLRRPADRPLAAFALTGASAVLDDGRPVLLPAVADLIRRAGTRGAIAARPAAVSKRMLRALVVDDSPIAREVVAELVASTGMEVVQAGDGQAGLDLLDARGADLIVTDVEMPRVDGFELTRRVRAKGLRTPIVVVTTRGSVEDKRRAAECGADAYVVKTEFRDSDLLQTVRGLVVGIR
jgi:chemotaxis protein histidine kinase CheA/CheY-like chemotaxis protein